MKCSHFPPAPLVGLLLIVACDGESTLPPEPVPSTLRIITGDNQLGLANETLGTLLVVKAEDSEGKPVPRVSIDWVVDEGGGTISPNTTPNSIDQANALASATFTLGADGLPQRVTARVSRIPDGPRVTFKARSVTSMVSVKADYDYCFYYGNCSPHFYFSPSEVVVPAGRTVAWVWPPAGVSECNVVFEDNPTEPTSSPTQKTGMHFRTFSTPGTYRYRCTQHSTSFTEGAVGKVTVQ